MAMMNNPSRAFGGDTNKAANVGRTLARFGGYFRKRWLALILVLLFAVGSTWMSVTTPELIGQSVDCFLTPTAAAATGGSFPGLATQTAARNNCWLSVDGTPNGITQSVMRSVYTAGGFTLPTTGMDNDARVAGLGRLIVLVIALFAFSAVLTGLTFLTMSWAGQQVLRDMRVSVFDHLHRLSQGFYGKHEAGDLMSRITSDTEAIGQMFGFGLVSLFTGVLSLIWTAYNMITKSVPFALLSLVVVPIMFLVTTWFSGQARKAFRRSRKQMGSVNAELQETISSVREVQAFNRVEENIENFRAINAANRDANVQAVAFTSALAPALEALGYLALAIVTVGGGYALLNGQNLFGEAVSLGLIITFMGYVQRFNQPIQQISVLWTNLQNAIAGGERIFGLLDEPVEIANRSGATALPRITGRVAFENVTAAYKADEPVLKGVTFEAQPGQTVAIVGPTGAGKTTIINLIPRFYDVTGGAVKIDGHDTRDVTLQSLREQIGIVLQDTFLFSATVMENIRFGRPDATDEEVMAAARLSRADTFIERLAQKYQTVLGERGSGLSQGQRQLLSIARAALANPRILILDEATSSVDTRTERLIQNAIETLMKGRTSFVIAHRLSTIQHADLLLVLNKGEIVERGRHEELLARKGFYYDLYMSQFWRGDAEATGNAQPALAPA
ncbi:MAG: ABC transporter ATP-binding protein/permease [Thermoflexales bacterium]|nr:ABC transporter ATP-binding protein/permease [Thermoflexales bacterium]